MLEAIEPDTLEPDTRLLEGLAFGHALQLERHGDIALQAQPGVQRMLLEHQGTSRARLGDRLAIGKHAASAGLLQPRHQVQQGRLAAARRPDQGDQLALGELAAEPLDDFELPEALVYIFKPELHKNPQIQKRNGPAMRAK